MGFFPFLFFLFMLWRMCKHIGVSFSRQVCNFFSPSLIFFFYDVSTNFFFCLQKRGVSQTEFPLQKK